MNRTERLREDSLSAAEMSGRLLAFHSSTTVRRMSLEERTRALDWYPDQGDTVRAIGRELGIGGETSIACAATLSPATSWSGLIERLPVFMDDVLRGALLPDFPTYGLQRWKAAGIVRDRLGVRDVTGPKVRPFAEALSGDVYAVVIDRHSARLATGDPSIVGPSPVKLRRAQEAHRRAGRVLGIHPRDLQSLLWVARVGFGGMYAGRADAP